ncbi:YdbH family protein [Dickeya solani]|uniref:YdbH family protein n=2 Tax=Dickeya solani TaxID=1089444 RepID=A0ABU4EGB8_9GAMM|nr:YdbH family protein [Dickeya solani]MCA6999212.1 YdbH family protein [Dickeya solani]MCZ0820394.1 YdbH family protein [Dickeya solani]MDV6995944.1 YdbH family protein [Dickeya solani]MDV7005661.1 YdbH family protein [Dickeya solani]MDV7037299.1 YdbH family protein [Dickeya solani]
MRYAGWLAALAFALAFALATACWTMPRWLPVLLRPYLPVGVSLALQAPPGWRQGGFWLPDVQLRLAQCQPVTLSGLLVRHHEGRWQLEAESLTLDAVCLQQWPVSSNMTTPLLAQWQQRLPQAELILHRVAITPWLTQAGSLQLSTDPSRQQLRIQSGQLQVQAELHGAELTLQQGQMRATTEHPPLQINGAMQLAPALNRLPEQGEVQGQQLPLWLPEPASATLRWHGNQGELTVGVASMAEPLLTLPWQVSDGNLRIHDGRWRWPYASQPLTGGIALTLYDVLSLHDPVRLEARLNVLTQGHNGRANAVLSLGPGQLGLTDSDIHFQLTGQANLPDLSIFASLPGTVKGAALDPTVVLLPGSLLRAWGAPRPTVTLEEARWPLAGIQVTRQGVSGRLQAIVKIRDSYWGRFRLHLDGKAQQFWPDSGDWRWRYWGEGHLPPLQGSWDIAGHGRWQDDLIEVESLSSGLNQLRYGVVTVDQPRLTLTEPLRWRRDPAATSLQGALRLAAKQVNLQGAGMLPATELTVAIRGRNPQDFQWRGQLQADPVGPIQLSGRWDGKRLRGNGWWSPQPLRVFQTLLPPAWKLAIRTGQFYAQAAFSAARGQGFRAGGHWVVKNGGAWLEDGEVSGVNFVLPYRFENHRWQLGISQPVTLRINRLDSLFPIRNIDVQVYGAYPYSERHPLTLAQLDLDVLDGHLSLSPLRLPAHDAAVLRLQGIDLGELMAGLKAKKLAMSGRVSGVLPLNFSHSSMLVQDGKLTNDTPLTVQLDPQLADQLAQNSVANAAAVAWLRYMEIRHSWVTLDLSQRGELSLVSRITGHSVMDDQSRRDIVLNYRQQENIFQLWHSLRFGDNLKASLEQQVAE